MVTHSIRQFPLHFPSRASLCAIHFKWTLLSLMRTPRLPAVDWIDNPAGLNGLLRFAERRYLVSARVPSHFKRSLQRLCFLPKLTLQICWRGCPYSVVMNAAIPQTWHFHMSNSLLDLCIDLHKNVPCAFWKLKLLWPTLLGRKCCKTFNTIC